jgi:hypothetical protein
MKSAHTLEARITISSDLRPKIGKHRSVHGVQRFSADVKVPGSSSRGRKRNDANRLFLDRIFHNFARQYR